MASRHASVVMRRGVLRAAAGAGAVLAAPPGARASDEAGAYKAGSDHSGLVERLVGGTATPSPRVRLQMPPAFGNGYSVPLAFAVDSEMTDADHVRAVHIIAPLNPIPSVAIFRFSPGGGRAEVATRIRLAKSQTVLAVAEMSGGTLLLGRAEVDVDTDGCA